MSDDKNECEFVSLFFLYYSMLPGAYVRIEESIQYIPMMPQLRVYSAGVWHNIVLAICCVLALWALPSVLSFGFYRCSHTDHNSFAMTGDGLSGNRFSGGVVITHISSNSPLYSAISAGDLIIGINDVLVTSPTRFSEVITDLKKETAVSLIKDDAASAIERRYSAYWNGNSEQDNHNQEKILRDVLVAPSGVCVSAIDVERLMVPELQCCRDILLSADHSSHSHTTTDLYTHQDVVNSCFLHYDVTKSAVAHSGVGHHPYVMATAGSPQKSQLADGDVNIADGTAGTSSKAALYCLPARSVMIPHTATKTTIGSSQSELLCEQDSNCHNLQSPESVSDINGGGVNRDNRIRCLKPLTPYPNSILRLTVLPTGSSDDMHASFSAAIRREVQATANAPSDTDGMDNVQHVLRATASMRASTVNTELTLKTQHVLFEGTPDDLVSTVTIGEYMMQSWMLRVVGGVHSWFFSLLMMIPDTCALYLWLLLQV